MIPRLRSAAHVHLNGVALLQRQSERFDRRRTRTINKRLNKKTLSTLCLLAVFRVSALHRQHTHTQIDRQINMEIDLFLVLISQMK